MGGLGVPRAPALPTGAMGVQQPARPPRDFTPKKHDVKEKDIPVWTWLGEATKLWRLIFDDSRKEKNSLIQQWLENNKYHKCAFLGRCLTYPHFQLGIDEKIKDAKHAYKTCTGSKDEQRALKAAYDKVVFVGAQQKEYLERYCGNDERDQEAPGLGICKKQGIHLYKKQVRGEIDLLEDNAPDFAEMLVIWCEPTVQGLKDAVVYAALKDHKAPKEPLKHLTDRVNLRWKVKGKFEALTTDAQAKKLWTSSNPGEVVASGIGKEA
jgi:hypothetical protein